MHEQEDLDHAEKSNEFEEFEGTVLQWERPHFTWAGKQYNPIIYDVKELGGSLSERANSAVITLPAAPQDDMQWRAMVKAASRYVEDGINILWHLDLGVFHRLLAPMEQQQQKKSLHIAVDHFLQTVWRPFREASVGVCLYRGPLDLSQNVPSSNKVSSQAYSQQDCIDFLLHLAAPLMPLMPCVLALDAAPLRPPVDTAELLAPLLATDLCLALANTPIPADMVWADNHFFCTIQEPPTIGLCLPSPPLTEEARKKFDNILTSLLSKKHPFRLIPEESLTLSWDGLESLIVLSEPISVSLHRTLAGFAAAGGAIVYDV